MRFKGCSVTAFDLSRQSLAYAISKARRLDVRNIEFVQGDILLLDETLGSFDIIEAVGVLHHLEDPLKGWRQLLAHLQPGGLMKIGLYSTTGREPVRAAQELASQWMVDATTDGIREFRHRIMQLDETTEAFKLTRFTDFFSLSGCRDLVFHAREHWFTLPQIDNMLKELGLEFVGFELEDPAVLPHFKSCHLEDPNAVSLASWHEFELENRYIFSSMYQFWVRKPQ
jgi:SAM-dependent methyltransferase